MYAIQQTFLSLKERTHSMIMSGVLDSRCRAALHLCHCRSNICEYQMDPAGMADCQLDQVQLAPSLQPAQPLPCRLGCRQSSCPGRTQASLAAWQATMTKLKGRQIVVL